MKWVVQFHPNICIIEYQFIENNKTLKWDIRILQTEIMKEYIFYQIGVIMPYSSFQQNSFTLFLPPISAFGTLITVEEFTKIAICQATA